MGLDDEESLPTRKAWKSSNGSTLLTVTSLLDPGRYKVSSEEKDDGTVVLRFKPVWED